MKEIKLTQGQVALVDDEDFEYLNQFKWFAAKNGNYTYARRNIRVNGKRTKIFMHQVIMNGKNIDHANRNGCDNRRFNLRFSNKSENSMNCKKQDNKSSIFKGVCLDKKSLKWRSNIKINGKQKYLGNFNFEKDAALAYNKKAIEFFGEFANLNIIPNEN